MRLRKIAQVLEESVAQLSTFLHSLYMLNVLDLESLRHTFPRGYVRVIERCRKKEEARKAIHVQTTKQNTTIHMYMYMLASFFLPSHLSFKNMYMYMCIVIWNFHPFTLVFHEVLCTNNHTHTAQLPYSMKAQLCTTLGAILYITLSIQNSVLRLTVCILHPTETQSPRHILNTKDTPTITSLQLCHPADQMKARALYRALLAIRRPHAGRHLALVTFVHPT